MVLGRRKREEVGIEEIGGEGIEVVGIDVRGASIGGMGVEVGVDERIEVDVLDLGGKLRCLAGR